MVHLSWIPGATNGAHITQNRIWLLDKSSGPAPVEHELVLGANKTEHNVTRLVPGREYQLAVQGINRFGLGTISPFSDAFVLPASKPDAPSKPRLIQTTTTPSTDGNCNRCSMAMIQWDAPYDSSGLPVTHYQIRAKMQTGDPSVISTWKTVVPSTGSAVNDFEIEHLQPVGIYAFQVAAFNAIGSGPWSVSSKPVVTYAALPNRPAAPQVEVAPSCRPAPELECSLVIKWPDAEPNGAKIIGYTVWWSGPHHHGFEEMPERTLNPRPAALVQKLLPDSKYAFKVAAVSPVGHSQLSESSAPVLTPVVRLRSAAPVAAGSRFVLPANGSCGLKCAAVMLHWKQSSLGEQGARILMSSNEDDNFKVVVPNTGHASQYLVRGLPNHQDFRFKVLPLDANQQPAGTLSSPSDLVSTVGAPPDRIVSAATARLRRCTAQSGQAECQVQLSWKEPNANNDPILGYRISALVSSSRKARLAPSWVVAAVTPTPIELVADTESTELQRIVTGLGPELKYEFSVQAINSVGIGLKSPLSEPVVMRATTPSQVFPAPELKPDREGGGIVVLTHTGQCSGQCAYIDLVWTQPHPNGEPVQGYRLLGRYGHQLQPRVYVNDTGPTTQYRATQLRTNTHYQFQVQAYNKQGFGIVSRFSTTILTQAAVPDQIPRHQMWQVPLRDACVFKPVGAFNCTLGVQWDAPNDNGSPITSYHIQVRDRNNKADIRTIIAPATRQSITFGDNFVKDWQISVTALNDRGSAIASAFMDLLIAPQVPNPVVTTSIVELQNVNWTTFDSEGGRLNLQRVTLTWVPPYDNMQPIKKYVVYSQLEGEDTWQDVGEPSLLVEFDDKNAMSKSEGTHAIRKSLPQSFWPQFEETGKAGSAARFNNDSAAGILLGTPHDLELDTNHGFTIMSWVKLESANISNVTRPIFGTVGGSSLNAWSFGVNRQNISMMLSPLSVPLASSLQVSLDMWVHVAFSFIPGQGYIRQPGRCQSTNTTSKIIEREAGISRAQCEHFCNQDVKCVAFTYLSVDSGGFVLGAKASTLEPGMTVALRGGKDGKLCADEGNTIKCNRDSLGQQEQFTVVNAGNGKVGLRGGKDRKLCSDEDNTIKCNRNGLGQWEKFTVVNAGNGKVGLRGGKQGKLCADESNTIKCNRNGLGQSEKFGIQNIAAKKFTECSLVLSSGQYMNVTGGNRCPGFHSPRPTPDLLSSETMLGETDEDESNDEPAMKCPKGWMVSGHACVQKCVENDQARHPHTGRCYCDMQMPNCSDPLHECRDGQCVDCKVQDTCSIKTPGEAAIMVNDIQDEAQYETFVLDGSQSRAALAGSSAFVLALGLSIGYSGETSSFHGLMDRAAVYPVSLQKWQIEKIAAEDLTRYPIMVTRPEVHIPRLREGITYKLQVSAFNLVGEGSAGGFGIPCAKPGPGPGGSCVASPLVLNPALCGSGRRLGQEECDDGNLVPGDGCDEFCLIEPGWRCSGGSRYSADQCEALCGDGIRMKGVEECDDGNTRGGDGCDPSCRVETGGWDCVYGGTVLPDYCHNAMLGDRWVPIPIPEPMKALALGKDGRACAVSKAGQILCRENVKFQLAASSSKHDWLKVDRSGLKWGQLAISSAGIVALSPQGTVGVASAGEPAVTSPTVDQLKLDPASEDAWEPPSALAIPDGIYRFWSEETGTAVAQMNGGIVAKLQGPLYDDLMLHTVPSDQQLLVQNSHIVLGGTRVAIIPCKEPHLVRLQDTSTSTVLRVPLDVTTLPASFNKVPLEDTVATGTKFRMSRSASASTQSFWCPVLPTKPQKEGSTVSYLRYDSRVCTPDVPLNEAAVFTQHSMSFSDCMDICTNLGPKCGSIQWQMEDPLQVEVHPQCRGFVGVCGSTAGVPSPSKSDAQCVQVPEPASSSESPLEFDGKSIAGYMLCCPPDWQLAGNDSSTCTQPAEILPSSDTEFLSHSSPGTFCANDTAVTFKSECIDALDSLKVPFIASSNDSYYQHGCSIYGENEGYWNENLPHNGGVCDNNGASCGHTAVCKVPPPPPPQSAECYLFGHSINSTNWRSACPSVTQAHQSGTYRYMAESGTSVSGTHGAQNHPWSSVFYKVSTSSEAENNCVSDWRTVPPIRVNTGSGTALVGSVNKSGILLKVLSLGKDKCAFECILNSQCHHWIVDGDACELRDNTEVPEQNAPCTSPGSCMQGPQSCSYIHLPFMRPAAALSSLKAVNMTLMPHSTALEYCKREPWCKAVSCTTLVACSVMSGVVGAIEPISNSSLWVKKQFWGMIDCAMFEPMRTQASPNWHTVQVNNFGHDATAVYTNQANLDKLVRVVSPQGLCLVSGSPLRLEPCSNSKLLHIKAISQGPAIEWAEVVGVLCDSADCVLGRTDGGDDHSCMYNSDDRCHWNTLSIAQLQCARWNACSSFSVIEDEDTQTVVFVPWKSKQLITSENTPMTGYLKQQRSALRGPRSLLYGSGVAEFPISIQAHAAGAAAAAPQMPQWIRIEFGAIRVRAVRLHWADVWGYRLVHPLNGADAVIGEVPPCIDLYRVLAQSWKQLGSWKEHPEPLFSNTQQQSLHEPHIYHGNDGSISCSAFCSADWRGELRALGWTGACCQAAYKVSVHGSGAYGNCDIPGQNNVNARLFRFKPTALRGSVDNVTNVTSRRLLSSNLLGEDLDNLGQESLQAMMQPGANSADSDNSSIANESNFTNRSNSSLNRTPVIPGPPTFAPTTEPVTTSVDSFKFFDGTTELDLSDCNTFRPEPGSDHFVPGVAFTLQPMFVECPKAKSVTAFSFITSTVGAVENDPIQWELECKHDSEAPWVRVHVQPTDYDTPLERGVSLEWFSVLNSASTGNEQTCICSPDSEYSFKPLGDTGTACAEAIPNWRPVAWSAVTEGRFQNSTSDTNHENVTNIASCQELCLNDLTCVGMSFKSAQAGSQNCQLTHDSALLDTITTENSDEWQAAQTNRDSPCVLGSTNTCHEPPENAYTLIRSARSCRNFDPTHSINTNSLHGCAAAITASGVSAFFAYNNQSGECLKCLAPTGSTNHWGDQEDLSHSVYKLLAGWDILLQPIRDPPATATFDSERLERALGHTTHRVFNGSLCQDHLGWIMIAEPEECLRAAYSFFALKGGLQQLPQAEQDAKPTGCFLEDEVLWFNSRNSSAAGNPNGVAVVCQSYAGTLSIQPLQAGAQCNNSLRLQNSDSPEECANLMLHRTGFGACSGSAFSLNSATRECECATDDCGETTSENTDYSIYQLSQISQLCAGRHRKNVVDEFAVSASLDQIKIEFTDGLYDTTPTYVLSNVEVWEDSAAQQADIWRRQASEGPPVGGRFGSETLQPAAAVQSGSEVCVGVCGTSSTAACAGVDLNPLDVFGCRFRPVSFLGCSNCTPSEASSMCAQSNLIIASSSEVQTAHEYCGLVHTASGHTADRTMAASSSVNTWSLSDVHGVFCIAATPTATVTQLSLSGCTTETTAQQW
jgi:cysteine-rich repeat protein